MRDYIRHSTSIKATTPFNYNFNNFTLHYTLANGYIWDFHLLVNTQKLLHLYTLHPNDGAVRRAVHCILSKITEYHAHYLLTNTHGFKALQAQLLRTLTGTTRQQDAWIRQRMNYMQEPHGWTRARITGATTLRPREALQQQALPHELRSVRLNPEQQELLRTTPVVHSRYNSKDEQQLFSSLLSFLTFALQLKDTT